VRENVVEVLARGFPEFAAVFEDETLVRALSSARKATGVLMRNGTSAAVSPRSVEAAASRLEQAVTAFGPEEMPALVRAWADELIGALRSAHSEAGLRGLRRHAARALLEKRLVAQGCAADAGVWDGPTVLVGVKVPRLAQQALLAFRDLFAVGRCDDVVVLRVPSRLSAWTVSELWHLLSCSPQFKQASRAPALLVLPVSSELLSDAAAQLVADLVAGGGSWEDALSVALALNPVP
jgi:hypothetical protein